MQLVELPSELLLCIVNHLGSQFFHHDTRHLTLFRRWYPLAWLVLASELELTVQSLHKFVQNEPAYTHIRQHLGRVTLSLGQANSPPTFSNTRLHGAPPPRSIDIYSFLEARSRIDLTNSLLNLADKLQRCPKLHTLRLLQPAQLHGHGQVPHQPLAALLHSARHLTTLEIDIPMIPFTLPFLDRGAEHPHLCASIHALLPTLRRLRCRLRNVCECLLDAETLPQHPGADLLRLEEVIINLNLSHTIMGPAELRCLGTDTFRYQDARGAFSQPLRPSIERLAVALAKRMAKPRVVRVVSWELGLVSFDALTLERMRLEAGAAWDADGEVIGEGAAED